LEASINTSTAIEETRKLAKNKITQTFSNFLKKNAIRITPIKNQ